jgi:ankyrin repeat protein
MYIESLKYKLFLYVGTIIMDKFKITVAIALFAICAHMPISCMSLFDAIAIWGHMPTSCMDIFEAVASGDTKKVRAVLATVPGQKLEFLMQKDEGTGLTLLHMAVAIKGHTRTIKALLAAVPEDQRPMLLIQKDINGLTPLDVAIAIKGRTGTVETLLATVPEDQRLEFLMQKNINGLTPLDVAVLEGRTGTVGALLAAIPEDQRPRLLIQKNIGGQTTLSAAAFFGRIRVAKILITAGADLDLQGPGGCTPAEFATIKGHANTARLINKYRERIAATRQLTHDQSFALAQASQQRLGSDSPVALLSSYLFRDIMLLVRHEADWQARQPI